MRRVARMAAAEGHRVTLFLASDGAVLLRDDVIESLEGNGTGKLRDHVEHDRTLTY